MVALANVELCVATSRCVKKRKEKRTRGGLERRKRRWSWWLRAEEKGEGRARGKRERREGKDGEGKGGTRGKRKGL